VNELLGRHPIVAGLEGPNGAGKSSFNAAYLRKSNLPFINADQISLQTGVSAYKAAELAEQLRRGLVEQQDSFIFETVLSDPVGAKLDILKLAENKGYTALLIFIGVDSSQCSEERVAMRVSKGGHDVPQEKIPQRYARTMKNLQRALTQISNIRVYDNSDLEKPYRFIATKDKGQHVVVHSPTPKWLKPLLRGR